MHDLALGRVDEAHATHVGGQLVHFVKRTLAQAHRRLAVLLLAQIQDEELVRLGGGELVLLDVHAADPVPFSFQFLDQVPSDKAACTANQCCFHHNPLFVYILKNKVPYQSLSRRATTRTAFSTGWSATRIR